MIESNMIDSINRSSARKVKFNCQNSGVSYEGKIEGLCLEKMDRTLMESYKAEEKDLSEKLYTKLEGLMLIFPPSDDLKKHFSNDMFLKVNNAAFFHLFHYLFRIHDAAEFKKRFYWPIPDKRGESHFRCSTVEYLKFLSEKHNLNWNVKSYLVQMPGGMKFILFVLDLVAFIVSEQIRLKEKQLGIEAPAGGFTDLNFKRIQKKHLFFKDYTAGYVNEVEQQTLNLRRKTQLIKAELCEIECIIQTDIDRHFLQLFETSNERIYELKFKKQNQNILELEKDLIDLKEHIDIYQAKAVELRKDKSTLGQALQKINDSHDAVKPTMENMAAAFVQIQPSMENLLCNVVQGSSFMNSDMTIELIRLQLELEQTEIQIANYQQKFKVNAHCKTKDKKDKELFVNRGLTSKYVFTPPIRPNPTENPVSHLPLLGETSFHHNLEITRSTRKTKPSDTSYDHNITLNRSQIIDPAQMLRTIYKHSGKKLKASPAPSLGSLSLLGMKWKERQHMLFGEDDAENIAPIELDTVNSERLDGAHGYHIDIKVSSPITPFNAHSDDTTRIALTSYKHSPSLKKVNVLKEDAFNIKNLSTSPTGRLESLCSANEVLSVYTGAMEKAEKNTNEEIENNPNFINVPKKLTFDFNAILNDDSIFNTSDTILKDIL